MYTAIMPPEMWAMPLTMSVYSSELVIRGTYGFTIKGASVWPMKTLAATESVSAPLVPQLTDRRFAENNAPMPKKQNAPQTAWPREPIASRNRNAVKPRATTAAAMTARQASGVGGGGGGAGTAAWGNSASADCTRV